MIAIKLDARAADDFIMDIESELSCNPWSGTYLGNNVNIWIVTVADISGALILYYSFSDNEVWFQSIKREGVI